MNRKELERRLTFAIGEGVVEAYERTSPTRYIVFVSAMFEDGDHPVVIAEKRLYNWCFNDDGNTYMRAGIIGVKMSLIMSRDNVEFAFADDLRMFVDVLLGVDANESIKAVAKKLKQEAGT